MFSGRLYQSQIFFSFIRRVTSSEPKCCRPECVVPKQQNLDHLQFKLPCSRRFYSNHQDSEFSSKMTASRNAETKTKYKYTNRLIDSKSPYLLQHAHNPVDWFPWGAEAFEKAINEDKLIFLSVGYSTCHWCHVMERESFENEDIAKIMNEHFVNIKVDREERPDVDKVYMTFVQASSGSGGWPMSVFLKPDLKPVSGGTYYPPEDSYNRRGFKSELLKWAKEWRENKTRWNQVAERVTEVIRNATVFEVPMSENLISGLVPGSECWELCSDQLADQYEPSYGGFGLAPKFPQPSNLMFIFHAFSRNPSDRKMIKLKDMALHTLTMMERGGIHDHVSQGFARYSTDLKWHVPHFEKMLYDQAQLAVVYSYAYLVTKDILYQNTVRDILTYVCRDLSHRDGGFYSAEDADSYPTAKSEEKREGAFCVWTQQEIASLLDIPVPGTHKVLLSQVFSYHYNIKPQGNVSLDQMQIKRKSSGVSSFEGEQKWSVLKNAMSKYNERQYEDPHGELAGQNVLTAVHSELETAFEFGLELEVAKTELQQARVLLHEARRKRPRPHLDDKIITSWNGLMISGFAKAAEALQDKSYTERAEQAANFIKKHLYNRDTNTLLRSCYTALDGGVAQISEPINGFLDDYAFLIQGLLDLYEASLDAKWLDWAEQLQTRQDELFWDNGCAGYFSATHEVNLILRLKEDQDGAEPSGNSIACLNLLRLAAILDRAEWREQGARLLASFTSRLSSVPLALPALTSALMLHHDNPTQVIITGKPSDSDTAALLSVVRSRLIPGRVLLLADGDEFSSLHRHNETVRNVLHAAADGQPSAYVCRQRACSLPVTTPHDLAALLDEPPLLSSATPTPTPTSTPKGSTSCPSFSNPL